MNWTEFYIGLAFAVSQKSKDVTKHGCIITNQEHEILGLGFNGPPKGFPDEDMPTHRGEPHPNKYDVTIHSEVNAVNNCQHKPVNGIAYVTGKCCPPCLLHLYQNGVRQLYMFDRTSIMLNEDTEKNFNFLVEKSAKSKYGKIEVFLVKPNLSWLRILADDVDEMVYNRVSEIK